MADRPVPPALVTKMTEFYGSVDHAREAYRQTRDQVRAFNCDRKNLVTKGGKVVWVSDEGELFPVYASLVLYKDSPDSAFVLPS